MIGFAYKENWDFRRARQFGERDAVFSFRNRAGADEVIFRTAPVAGVEIIFRQAERDDGDFFRRDAINGLQHIFFAFQADDIVRGVAVCAPVQLIFELAAKRNIKRSLQ